MSLTLPYAKVYGTTASGPGGPRPIYEPHRMDFLCGVMPDGTAEHADLERRYQHRSDADRAAIRASHMAAGMTRFWIDTCKDNDTDEMEHPHRLVPYLKELQADGLGVVLGLAPEDAPHMQAKYSPVGRFIAALVPALEVWRPHITEVWNAVEVSETWKKASDLLAIARAIGSVWSGPNAIHLNQGKFLPTGTTSRVWWKSAKDAGVTHLAFQSTHPNVEDAGQGFLADPKKFKEELKRAVDYVAGNVKVVASEYAYYGKDPSPRVIATIRQRAYELGDTALEVPGISGFSNHGPGYWPPADLPPVAPGIGDEIDINAVRFFTRSGTDISKDIRSWPVQSTLSPRISGDHIYYNHTASLSWPEWQGVNANSWIGFQSGGGWQCYTNDYLRPGQSAKPWPKLACLNGEPVQWCAQHGETVCLMVSRIARVGDYENGKGRTQLVKYVIP